MKTLLHATAHEINETKNIACGRAGLGGGQHLDGAIELHESDSIAGYLAGFNRLLARTDVLWTKPSEMTFFAALGLPLVLSRAIGVHEERNAAVALSAGAAIPQGPPRAAGQWLLAALDDGRLATAARAGWDRLPREGLERIVGLVRAG